MKTTRNMMMSFMLAGSMILGASFASAQSMSGRQRPTTSNSRTTSVTSSSSSNNNRSAAAQSNVRTATEKPTSQATASSERQVNTNRNTSNTSRSSVGSASTQRGSTVTARPSTGTTTTSRPSTVTARPATTTPSATNSSSGTINNTRPSTGSASTARSSSGTSVTTARSASGSAMAASRSTTETTVRPEADKVSTNNEDVVKGSVRNSRPSTGGTVDNGKKNNGNGGNSNLSDRGGKRPSGNGTRPPVANPNNNPYRHDFRNNYDRGNWSRPLPPPTRPYRPAPIRYTRPVIPAHYRPYAGAPVIDRILGINFGSLFDISLNYLYTNNYYIDGYDRDIIYLRDVRMLNLLWPDVMLCYDSYGRLANAQFIISTGYADRSRYNRLYHDLCAVYGPPISVDVNGATWFGGNTTGYVTLTAAMNGARFYTTLYVGY